MAAVAAVSSEVDSLEKQLCLLRLRCSLVKSTPEAPVYITHMTLGQYSNVVATGDTSGAVRVYTLDELRPIGTINRYNKSITGLAISKSNENLLWTAASTSEMNCWDLRRTGEPVQQLLSPNNSCYTCCDVNSIGDLVATATEPCGEDVCIYIWDLRNTASHRSVISDSHMEDITQVRFHPTKSKNMASCSTDGLVCLFDVTHSEEEEALQWVLNSQSSVAQIGYYGSCYDKLYCLTHIETLQLWDAEQALILADHTDIRDVCPGVEPVEYLVDCLYQPHHDRLYLFGGKHNGHVQLFNVQRDGAHRTCSSPCGHTATVRCLQYHSKSDRIITGGEDSTICCWKAPSSVQLSAAETTPQGRQEESHAPTPSKAVTGATNRPRTKPYERRSEATRKDL